MVPPVNTEQSLRAGQIDVAVLGGTLRDKALARGGIHPLFTDYQLLGKFTAGSYVFRTDFIKKNPDTVRKFVSGVAKAIEWSRSQPRATVIAEFEKIIKARGRNEDDSQLQYWKSYGVAGNGGVIADTRVPDLDRLATRRRRTQADADTQRPLHQRVQPLPPRWWCPVTAEDQPPSSVGKVFSSRGGDGHRAVRRHLRCPQWRVPGPGRTERLRQVHAAGPARRAEPADLGRDPARWAAGDRTGPGLDRGVVFQQYALFPWRSAQCNVEFGLEAKGVPRRERRSGRGSTWSWSGCPASTTGTRTSCPAA